MARDARTCSELLWAWRATAPPPWTETTSQPAAIRDAMFVIADFSAARLAIPCISRYWSNIRIKWLTARAESEPIKGPLTTSASISRPGWCRWGAIQMAMDPAAAQRASQLGMHRKQVEPACSDHSRRRTYSWLCPTPSRRTPREGHLRGLRLAQSSSAASSSIRSWDGPFEHRVRRDRAVRLALRKSANARNRRTTDRQHLALAVSEVNAGRNSSGSGQDSPGRSALVVRFSRTLSACKCWIDGRPTAIGWFGASWR